ncbi:MAG: cadherin-like beta sandwich domain-containing protein, partial [Bacteroidales bacterium]|nr:cadherin-like beta sandwich domain-containing protein [Bacteroidales bacterium]
FESYDGYWSHDNGNDEWDGSGIGEGAPGGISKIDNYWRLQDCGDPTLMGLADPNNRKLQGYCDLTNFGGTATMLNDGVTLHFVARIATDGPLDDLVNADGSRSPWPAGGKGYSHHNDGSIGMIGVKQGAGGYIAFTLRTINDSIGNDGANIGVFTGLQLPPAKGNAIITGTNITAADTINTIALDPTVWHDYWVNIVNDLTGVGTHKVSVSVDGGDFHVFSVTATSHENYPGKPVIRMGLGNTFMPGAFDIRAFDFAPGLLPAPAIPVAHWKLNGDATDVYGQSDGTLVNGDATSYVEGADGQALDLGSGSPVRYINVPDNEVLDLDTGSFSVSMVVKIAEFAGQHELIHKGHNDDQWWALSLHDNSLNFYIDDDVEKTQWENPNISNVMTAGAWNHIVAVRDRDRDKLILYINGQELGTFDDITNGSINNPGFPLRIGSNHNEDPSAARQIDDVILYNVALSPEAVLNLYGKYVPQLPASLAAWWKLDGDATDYFETSDGTLMGGDAANYVEGLEGQALDLSIGTDTTYVEVADNPVVNVGLGEFTYSVFLKIADLDSNRKILHKGSASGKWYALALDGNTLSFAIDDGTNETSIAFDKANLHLYTDGWNHIAAIRDRIQDSIFLYVNQRIVGSAKDNTDMSIGSDLPLIIGAGENKDVKFNGMLDEIRFYNAPLSFNDLKSLSNKYGIDARYIPSSNANLRSITLAPSAALTPAFDKNVTEYGAVLPGGTTSVRVTALPEDFKSTLTGTGNVDVSSGSGTAAIVVTAEDGITVKTYTVNFIITGINEISGNGIIYYNPLEDCLIFVNIDNISRVEIYDMAGMKLFEKNDVSERMSLHNANLKKDAVFIVRIIAGNESSVMKFVR